MARKKRDGGPLKKAVEEGTSEVGMAVVASTLTTLAVFFPLVFVEGIAGQLFTDQALTITYSLAASLLVALTLIPMALGLEIGPLEPEPERPEHRYAVTRRAASVGQFVFREVPRTVLRDVRLLLAGLGRFLKLLLSPALNLFDRLFESVDSRYPRVLNWSLDNKPIVFGIVAVSLIGAGLTSSQLGSELIPPLTQGEFSFEVELPEGTPIETTDGILREVEESVAAYPEVGTVFSTIGGSQQNQFAVGSTVEENFGRISVVMKDKLDKEGEQRAIERLRAELSGYPEASYTFLRPTLFSFKTPIEVEIFGYDLEDQRLAASLVTERLAQIEGLSDLQTTTRLANPEIQIRFDRERLARLGLQENQIAEALRNKIRGDVASRYREGDRQIDILVRADESDRDAISDIRNLVVNAPRSQNGNNTGGLGGGGQGGNDDGDDDETSAFGISSQSNQGGSGNQQQQRRGSAENPIRLAQVADITIARGPSEIRRIRSQRAAVVSANLSGRDLASVSQEIRGALIELSPEMPVNVTVGLGGQNEELETSYNSLMFALSLAVFLVYLVMASQFESLVHPFLILFSVPLALVGVVFALALTGSEISVVTLLGVIILAGIVVNNAIVLIDYANQMRRKGYPKREALLRAGQVRLRPIVMTTLTTVLGLAPMAVGWGEGAEIRAPMAIAVMGGLTVSTLLTLILIPTLYEIADRRVYEADREPLPRDEAFQGAD